MKRVLLLRHAEATPAHGPQQDFERPLSERGRAQALALAQQLAAGGLHVDRLLVSPARRTRETGAIVAAGLGAAERVYHEPALYPGTPESLWATLRQLPEQVCGVLLLAHNPALSMLARELGAVAPGSELPTAGFCMAGFAPPTRWSALRPELACALGRD
jgi:phosphohistidine phosphatase